MKILYCFLYIVCLLFLPSLTSEKVTIPKEISTLKLRITNRFGKEILELNKSYKTLLGDEVSITKFKYYLSNIVLTRKDGSSWKQPSSYHLIEVSEETQATQELILKEVPTGEYTMLSFALGIDSLSNHSGEQTGALDPDRGMFWMWESGYVFFKCEGFYHQAVGVKGPIVYHIGRDNCYQPVTVDLQNHPLKVSTNNVSQLQLGADVSKLFGGFPDAAIDVKMPVNRSSVSVMGGVHAYKISSNYKHMFTLE